jgi:hypothetical protein
MLERSPESEKKENKNVKKVVTDKVSFTSRLLAPYQRCTDTFLRYCGQSNPPQDP